MAYSGSIQIGESDKIMCTAEILYQFIFDCSLRADQIYHIFRIRTSECIDVLVIIPHCNHPHILIDRHQSLDQIIFIFIHILSFIYHQNRLGYPTYIHLSGMDFPDSLTDNSFRLVYTSYSSEKIETIGMECLYLDK